MTRTVPTNRLIWLAAVMIVPGLTGALAGFPALGWGVVALGCAVAVLDWWGGSRVLEGVTLQLPEVLRAGRGKVAALTTTLVHHPGRAPRRVLVGLPFHRALETGGKTREFRPVRGRGATVQEWPLRCLRRGRYEIDAAYLEAASPLGLWAKRSRVPVDSEVRVYPDLGSERRQLSSLFLHRGGGGTHAVRQVGKGREFEQLREYSHGDDFADIYWRATAKRGFPVTKVYQLEKTQEVYVVVDHSRLTAREVGGDEAAGAPGMPLTSLDRFLAAALALGLVAESRGDHIGVVTFAEQVDGFIRARNGKGHYDACREALYALESREVTPDFEELVVFLRTRLTRRALVVVLTDLGDAMTAEAFADSIGLLTRQHLVMVVALRPAVARPLFAAADARTTGDVYRHLTGQFAWEELNETGRRLEQLGAQFLVPERDALTPEIVGRYLSIKSRQLI